MDQKILAADVGHCNTTIARPHQPKMGENKFEIRRLVAHEKDQVILTQLILTNEQMSKLKGHNSPDFQLLESLGEIQIGNSLPHSVKDGEKFRYFKVAPKDFDKPYGVSPAAKEAGITHGMLMACFAHALLNNILMYNVGDVSQSDRADITLLVGCPTTEDWTGADAESKYADLIKKATGVKNVKIIAESRAAMFSSIENEKNQISAVKGAVVFDFGSSTADCTYMLLGKKRIEFSWTLGASKIEQLMALVACRKAAAAEDSFYPDMESILKNEDDLRAAKEKYYDGIYGSEGHKIICEFTDAQSGSTIDSIVRVDEKFMHKITAEEPIEIVCDSTLARTGTWQELCRDFFEAAKNSIEINGGAIDTVILTGGACKMDFIKTLCEEVFGDTAKVRIEDNPSHTVSNGLGWIAVSEANLDYCKEEAKKYIDNIAECDIYKLRKSISDAFFDEICDIAEEKANWWASDNYWRSEPSIAHLQEEISSHLKKDSTIQELHVLCDKKISAWKDTLSVHMEKAVNGQVSKLYAENVARGIIIPKDIWEFLQAQGLQFNNFNPYSIIYSIDITSVTRKIAQLAIIIAATAIGAVGGPIGAGIGYIIGSALAECVEDTDLEKPRSDSKRKAIAGKIRNEMINSKETITSSFESELDKFSAAYPEMLDETLQKAFEIVMLKRFEL